MDIYKDKNASISDRVEDLLKRMTLEEKVGQMVQSDGRSNAEEAVLKKHVGSFLHVWGEQLEEIQKLTERSRLKIPLVFGIDAIHGNAFWGGATVFPAQLGQACSFDEELVENIGEVTARETAATGPQWVFSPVFCLARDLRWGRIDETYGEDKLLVERMGRALIRGLQGNDPSQPQRVAACAKHYAGYSETEGGRDASEANLSKRRMLSTFLPAFEGAAKEGCLTFMTGYQAIDGLPCTANPWVMKDILRERWNWQGMVVTDWGNTGRMVREQKIFEDLGQASRAAVNCENDMIMVTPGFEEEAVKSVKDGLLDIAIVDRCVSRVLALKFKLGLFDGRPGGSDARRKSEIALPQARELNLQSARKSWVLLKNEGVLPLAGIKKLALLGPLMDDPLNQLGDWSNGSGQAGLKTAGHPREMVKTPCDGLKNRCALAGVELLTESLSQAWPVEGKGVAASMVVAGTCDVVVVVVGDHVSQNGECCDRADLDLSHGQQALLEAVKASAKRLVVVIISGKPLTIPWIKEHADAVLQAFSPGMEAGTALAELMFGDIEPQAWLPISYARHVGQQPVHYDRVPGWHNDKYCDMDSQPLWAFGEGMSYTRFSTGQPSIEKSELISGKSFMVSVPVKNEGKRDGWVLVQLYLTPRAMGFTWPTLTFAGWCRLKVSAGTEVLAQIKVEPESLRVVDPDGNVQIWEGNWELLTGLSSREEDLKRIGFRVVKS